MAPITTLEGRIDRALAVVAHIATSRPTSNESTSPCSGERIPDDPHVTLLTPASLSSQITINGM